MFLGPVRNPLAMHGSEGTSVLADLSEGTCNSALIKQCRGVSLQLSEGNQHIRDNTIHEHNIKNVYQLT